MALELSSKASFVQIEKLVWKRVMQMMFYSVKISFLVYKTKDNNHIYQVDQQGYGRSLSLLPQPMKSFEITLWLNDGLLNENNILDFVWQPITRGAATCRQLFCVKVPPKNWQEGSISKHTSLMWVKNFSRITIFVQTVQSCYRLTPVTR